MKKKIFSMRKVFNLAILMVILAISSFVLIKEYINNQSSDIEYTDTSGEVVEEHIDFTYYATNYILVCYGNSDYGEITAIKYVEENDNYQNYAYAEWTMDDDGYTFDDHFNTFIADVDGPVAIFFGDSFFNDSYYNSVAEIASYCTGAFTMYTNIQLWHSSKIDLYGTLSCSGGRLILCSNTRVQCNYSSIYNENNVPGITIKNINATSVVPEITIESGTYTYYGTAPLFYTGTTNSSKSVKLFVEGGDYNCDLFLTPYRGYIEISCLSTSGIRQLIYADNTCSSTVNVSSCNLESNLQDDSYIKTESSSVDVNLTAVEIKSPIVFEGYSLYTYDTTLTGKSSITDSGEIDTEIAVVYITGGSGIFDYTSILEEDGNYGNIYVKSGGAEIYSYVLCGVIVNYGLTYVGMTMSESTYSNFNCTQIINYGELELSSQYCTTAVTSLEKLINYGCVFLYDSNFPNCDVYNNYQMDLYSGNIVFKSYICTQPLYIDTDTVTNLSSNLYFRETYPSFHNGVSVLCSNVSQDWLEKFSIEETKYTLAIEENNLVAKYICPESIEINYTQNNTYYYDTDFSTIDKLLASGDIISINVIYNDSSTKTITSSDVTWSVTSSSITTGYKKTFKASYTEKDITVTSSFSVSSVAKPISLTTASGLPSSPYVYDGYEWTPSVTIKDGTTTLTKNTHYTVSYSNNINAGTGIVVITGKGYYGGSMDLEFKIDPCELTSEMITISDGTYNGGEIVKPDISVKFNGKDLTINSDFTAPFSATQAGPASVTVTGKGNFTGSVQVSYTINKADLTVDMITNLKNYYEAKVYDKVTDINLNDGLSTTNGYWEFIDKTLVLNQPHEEDTIEVGVKFIPTNSNYNSYSSTTHIMVYRNDLTIEVTNDLNKEFDYLKVSEVQYILNGERDEETPTVQVAYYASTGAIFEDSNRPINVGDYYAVIYVAKSNGYNSTNLRVDFTISSVSIDELTNKVIVNPIDDIEYMVEAIEPEVSMLYLGNGLVSGSDYTVKYANNIYPSNDNLASIIITGIGNFTGTRTVNFKIIKKQLVADMVQEIENQMYTGLEIEPVIYVINNGYRIPQNIDYEIVNFENNISPSTNDSKAKVTINGLGYYEGTATIEFIIVKKLLEAYKIAEITYPIDVNVGDTLFHVSLPQNSFGRWTITNEDDRNREMTILDHKTYIDITFIPNSDLYQSYNSKILLRVSKRVGAVDVLTTSLDKVYDGKPINTPEYISYGIEPTIEYFYLSGRQLEDGQMPTAVGSYFVVISTVANDEYDAETYEMYVTISAREITKDMISSVEHQIYTGKSIKPEIIVTDGDYILVEDQDYYVMYYDNIFQGNATFTVTGIGNYSSEVDDNTFSIVLAGDQYQDIDGDVYTITIEEIGTQFYTGTAIMPEIVLNGDYEYGTDKDYTIEFLNNIEIGTATVILHFNTIEFVEEPKFYFSIVRRPLSTTNISYAPEVSYTGEPQVPTVTITYDSNILVENKDYTVDYSNNVNVGTATITIQGKGNFSGQQIKYFNIVDGAVTNKIFKLNGKSRYLTFVTLGSEVSTDTLDRTNYEYNGEQIIYMKNIADNQKIDAFLQCFENNASTIKVYKNGNEIASSKWGSTAIGNGFIFKIVIDGIVYDEFTAIVRGDVDGNGYLTITDQIMLDDYFLYQTMLSDNEMLAIDVDGNNLIFKNDRAYLKNYWDKNINFNADYLIVSER